MAQSPGDEKSASEYPKTLAERLELDYYRRPRPMGVLRARTSWLLFFACAAIVVAFVFGPGYRSFFQAAPVSTPHAMFNDDCSACHTVRFAPARRLGRGGDDVRSVTDAACSRCHTGAVHHERQLGETACAACHREHRGLPALARVEDSHCTACHADLKAHTDRGKASTNERVFRDVSGFLRGSRPHPPFAPVNDPGTIRFTHKQHLDPAGVLVPGSPVRKVLRCGDCHELDSDRRYMRPISYERQCRSCHVLPLPVFADLQDAGARQEAERFRDEPAPHPKDGETAATVRAVIRDRYLEFARRFPSVVQSGGPTGGGRLLPSRQLAPRPSAKSQADWAERQVDQASRLLFRGAGGCRFCHVESVTATSDSSQAPQYEPPAIKDRWFMHSVFNHDSHRSLSCQQCHAGAETSAQASDVLMPGLVTCQQCHNGKAQGARSDCVECHAYHAPGESRRPSADLTIADFLKAAGRRAPALGASGSVPKTR